MLSQQQSPAYIFFNDLQACYDRLITSSNEHVLTSTLVFPTPFAANTRFWQAETPPIPLNNPQPNYSLMIFRPAMIDSSQAVASSNEHVLTSTLAFPTCFAANTRFWHASRGILQIQLPYVRHPVLRSA